VQENSQQRRITGKEIVMEYVVFDMEWMDIPNDSQQQPTDKVD